jgi:hypothetical protein
MFHFVSGCGIKLFVINGLRQKCHILRFAETPCNMEHHYTTIYTTLFCGLS